MNAVPCPPEHRSSAIRGVILELQAIEQRCVDLSDALADELGLVTIGKIVRTASATIKIAVARLDGLS